jgi:hypothetical protein
MAFDGRSRTPPLTTIQNVGIEIARVYRKTKRGEIDTGDGYRLVQMLAVLRTCLETSELEKKIEALELVVARGLEQRPEHFRPRMVS